MNKQIADGHTSLCHFKPRVIGPVSCVEKLDFVAGTKVAIPPHCHSRWRQRIELLSGRRPHLNPLPEGGMCLASGVGDEHHIDVLLAS
jgi:hypothetical protein